MTEGEEAYFLHTRQVYLARLQVSPSDGEDDPAEWATLNLVTQSISRFGQREGLSQDRFDSTGFKQRNNNVPSLGHCSLRLREHAESQDAGLWNDEICYVNGCRTACGISQCRQASARGERFDRLAQDFATDSVDHNVCSITARDTTHAVTQLFQGGVDDFIESECLRLLGFPSIGGGRDGVFCSQSARQLRHRVADRSANRRR